MKNKIKLLMQSVFQICGSFEVWPQGTKIEMSVCFCQSDFKEEFGG